MAQLPLAITVTVADASMSAGSKVLTSPSASFIASQVGFAVAVSRGAIGTTGTDGVMSSTVTPTVLTSVAAPFTADMVGDGIKVAGAGAAGADLITTIAAYTSAGSVTLTLPALTTVSGANFSVDDGVLNTTIVSVNSSTQLTLAAAADLAVSNTTASIAWAGAIDIDTSNYEMVAISSNVLVSHGSDSVTVDLVLPDGQGVVPAIDINGGNVGFDPPNMTRWYYGGPTYRITKVGTSSKAGLYVDFASRTV